MERATTRAACDATEPTRGRLSDEAYRLRFAQYRRSGSLALRNRLVLEHQWIAERCARRFAGRGVPDDDLKQVAYLGLISAVDHFDPEQRASFWSYAIPTIDGEIKRHFRDSTWVVKVPRRSKEVSARVRDASDRLSQELRHTPTTFEIADHLHIDCDSVRLALHLVSAHHPGSLSAATSTHEPDAYVQPGTTDDISTAHGRIETQAALDRLDDVGRRVIVATFFEDKTQREIAAELCITQSQVSRVLRRAVRALRRYYLQEEPARRQSVADDQDGMPADFVA